MVLVMAVCTPFMPGPPGPAALAAADGLVVHPTGAAAEDQVVHGALAGGADPVGGGLGQGQQAHVGDPLADLHVAGADRGRRPSADDGAGRDDRAAPVARVPPLAGMVGSVTLRSAQATALAVTAATALTLPRLLRLGASEVERGLGPFDRQRAGGWRPAAAARARAPSSRARPRRSSVPSGSSARAARMRRSP